MFYLRYISTNQRSYLTSRAVVYGCLRLLLTRSLALSERAIVIASDRRRRRRRMSQNERSK